MPRVNLTNSNSYNAANIKYMSPREHVRLRPGMYIGGTDRRALHQMLWYTLDDAIIEFEGRVHNSITIKLLPDKTISVEDDGLGLLPVIGEAGISHIEAHLTYVGSGRSIRKGQILAPVGTHGFGLAPINALSSLCRVEVKRDGFLWQQTYREGLPITQLEQIRALEADESTGTSISFTPDFTVMDDNDFDFELIAKRCQELAYLFPELCFTLVDERETKREMSFYCPQGLIEWLKAGQKPVSDALSIYYDCELFHSGRNQFYIVTVELALQWIDNDMHQLQGFVNRHESPKGGTHLSGLIAALCKHLEIRSWPKLRRGFTGIIHVLHPEPLFADSFSSKLASRDVYTAIDEAIEALFAAHPEAKEAIQAHFKRS